MEDEVSIIVPCYNVENYVKKCLDSIIRQTYENIEIICINDGSTDNTLKILKEYKKRDNRIIIVNKKNAGVASARNDGIKKSKGKYILFVDSDDYIEQDMVKCLLSNSKEYKADIVKCNRADVYVKESTIINRKPIWSKKMVIEKYEFKKYIYPEFFNRNKLCNIWMTLIKKELLSENNILFDEEMTVNEDEVFATQIFSVANKFVYIPTILYFYVKNTNGLSSNGVNIYKRFESRKRHANFIKDFTKEWNLKNQCQMLNEKIAFMAIHTMMQTALPNKKYTRIEQYRLFKKVAKDDFFENYIYASKGKIMLLPEKILLGFVKLHTFAIAFGYAILFEKFMCKYRFKLEKIRKG